MDNRILDELSKPFHPSRIVWRTGALTGKKDKALAVVYADLRAYQNRLDETCGLDWSVSYTPWGDRIICHLTINGITRSSTGEADSDAERSEIAGTSAEAQAFTRACAMFGLGRYLYNLPVIWVEYDAENQRFTEKSKAQLHGIIAQHYQRFLNEQPDLAAELTEGKTEAVAPSSAIVEPVADDGLSQLRQKLDELGKELYGEQWQNVRAHNVKRLLGDNATPGAQLNQEQLQTLINGLKRLKQQRRAV